MGRFEEAWAAADPEGYAYAYPSQGGQMNDPGMGGPMPSSGGFGGGGGGDIIGGIASGLGSFAGSLITAGAMKDVNAQQIALSERQMEYQRQMSNSAYQRAMQDMRAAGLNPMLAYQQGGAGTPSGSQPPGLNVPDVGKGVSEGLQKGLASAIELRRVKNESDLMQSQTMLQAVTASKEVEQAKLNAATARNVETNTAKTQVEIPALKAEAGAREAHGKLNKEYSTWDNWQNRINNFIHSAVTAVGGVGQAVGGFGRGVLKGPGKPTPPLTPAQKDYINKSNYYNKTWK